MTGTAPKVAVIGAGIIGASIAYHLARRGAAVTVLDRAAPAGGSTAKSFAWINASFGNPEHYYHVRVQSLLEWHRLEAELAGSLQVKWGGSVMWESDMAAFEPQVRRHQAWGYPVRMIDREEFTRLEPRVADPPELAAFSECEGSVEPVATTGALLAAAGGHGALLLRDREVLGCATKDRRVVGVETGEGTLEADHVVLAAGTAAQGLADKLGVALPMENSPGLLIHTNPLPPLLNRLVLSPSLHMKQDPSGVLVVGEDFGGGPAPDDPWPEGRRHFERLRARLPSNAAIELAEVTVGDRVIPAGGLPAVGPAPALEGLTIAVMHSGVTLAPLVGRLVAVEILDEIEVELLAPYRPARFA